MFGGNFAPAGWMFCEGQLLAISQNDTLFNLIGTTYGGDGLSTFALPDLRGRLPIHQGGGFILGQAGGSESVTLTINQIPTHSHALLASASVATGANPANAVPGQSPSISMYESDVPAAGLNAVAITALGGSQPHLNMQPFLTITFCIALQGIFPSRN